MLILITGLALWIIGHMWRYVLPDAYASLGRPAYFISLAFIVAGVINMVVGYKAADTVFLYALPSFFVHINNVLMVAALYIFFTTATVPGTAWIAGSIKHPQLTGFKIWAIAHLLVNGDLASLVLFGGLLGWAVFEVITINRRGKNLDRAKAPIKSPWVHLGLVIVVLIAIIFFHTLAGVSPVGG